MRKIWIVLVVVIAVISFAIGITSIKHTNEPESPITVSESIETPQSTSIENNIPSNITVTIAIPLKEYFKESSNYIVNNVAVTTTIPIREQYPYRFPMRGP